MFWSYFGLWEESADFVSVTYPFLLSITQSTGWEVGNVLVRTLIDWSDDSCQCFAPPVLAVGISVAVCYWSELINQRSIRKTVVVILDNLGSAWMPLCYTNEVLWWMSHCFPSLVCYFCIPYLINIDTEYHLFLPCSHPHHRGRFKS